MSEDKKGLVDASPANINNKIQEKFVRPLNSILEQTGCELPENKVEEIMKPTRDVIKNDLEKLQL